MSVWAESSPTLGARAGPLPECNIVHVVRVGSGLQVVWVDAWRVVALVTDVQVGSEGPLANLKHQAVDSRHLQPQPPVGQQTVTQIVPAPAPLPASALGHVPPDFSDNPQEVGSVATRDRVASEPVVFVVPVAVAARARFTVTVAHGADRLRLKRKKLPP